VVEVRRGDGVGIALEEVGKGQKHDRSQSASSRLGRWSPHFFGRKDSIREKEKEKKVVVVAPAVVTGHGRSAVDSQRDLLKRDGQSSTAKVAPAAVRSKHGSFDFENPAWVIPGGAGVVGGVGQSEARNTVEKKPSVAATSREHADPRSMPPPSIVGPSKPKGTPNSSRPMTPATGGSSAGHSQNTANTGRSAASGQGPSTSKAADPSNSKTAFTALTRSLSHTRGRVGRFVGVSAGHGSFAFEPAVPPPPPFSSIPALAQPEGAGGSQGAKKGKRLDLGLGLAWAPSKVKEEAVLVSGFGRGRIPRAHGETAGETEKECKSKVGPAVTETFRGILGEAGFSEFKKCMLSSSLIAAHRLTPSSLRCAAL
jgi:hypothetical protein